MTVSTEVDHNDYTGNGVTTSFPYTFRIFKKSDLTVQVADLNENITVLTLDTDYSVTGAGTYSGGNVVLMSPLANGWQISISRDLPVTQETDLRNQGKFFAEVHEDAFDKLTMLIQQCFSFLRLALRKPSFIANYYDALNNRIRNLRDPSQAQDAATKKYVDDGNAGSNSYADSLFRRTLRAPEDYIDIMPSVNGRRGKLLAFDSLGRPIAIHSETDDGTQLEIDMAGPDGLKYIGQCPDINTLRQIEFSFVGQQIFLREHTVGQASGGGIFYCHSLTSDLTHIDDNGCQIINDYGQVLRRKDIHHLYSDMFGLIPGGNIDPVLNNMYKASRTFKIEDAWICHQGYGNPSYRSNGGLDFDLSDGIGFYVRGVTTGAYGPTILHAGNNVCMWIHKNIATANEFWISGGVLNLRIVGRDDTFTTNNSNTGATPLRVSDMWGAQLKHLYISGYVNNTSGAAISLYNATAWTEGVELDDVIVRSSAVGLKLHRNKTAGSTATDSFKNLKGNISINAGISGMGINYMVIGDGTPEGKCFLYGHDLTITGWMSNGSWHNGIFLSNYSECFNGKITLNWDGYGINSSASSEVIHLLRVGGPNARLDCDVINYSGQSNGYPISMVQLIANSCLYLNDTNLLDGTLNAAYPIIRPKGLVMKFKGSFTQAQCVSGLSYQLSALLPGMKLKVRLSSWAENSKYQTLTQEWDVHVRGNDYPCIVKPVLNAGTTLATASAQAVTAVSPETKASFLNSATLTTSQVQQNALYGTTLTLTNGQANNGIGYSANSGRKINFVLPADADATQEMPYQIEIEVM